MADPSAEKAAAEQQGSKAEGGFDLGVGTLLSSAASILSTGVQNLVSSFDETVECRAFSIDDDTVVPEAPSGQYQVIVTVVEGRDLTAVQFFSLLELKRNAPSEDTLPSSWVKMKISRADGSVSIQKTPIRKNTSSPLWESRHFFMFTVQKGELASTGMTLTVYDQKRFVTMSTKPLMIGSIDVDLEAIYAMPGHEVYRRWYTLYETKARREGPQGQLLLSIQVLAEGDKPVPHNDAIEEDLEDIVENTDASGIAQVSSNEMELYHFQLKLFRGRDLPQVDADALVNGQGIDPYVKLSCASTKPVMSKVKYGTRNPKWNQQISLNVQVPIQKGANPVIKVQLFDKDTFGKDDLVATTLIRLRDVVLYPQQFSLPRWQCLYGAPPELERRFEYPGQKQSKLHRKMNNASVAGSDYRGMILFSCSAQVARKPLESRRRGIVDPPRKFLLKQWHVLMVELLTLELFQLEEGVDGKLQIKVTCGLESAATGWFVAHTGPKALTGDMHAEVCQRVRLPVRLPLNLYYPEGRRSGEQHPDVTVEVWWKGRGALGGGARRVGYARRPMSTLQPPVRVFHAARPPLAYERGAPWTQEGWLDLTSDALATRGRGSTTVRHKRPMGIILTRMLLLQPQTAEDDGSSDSDDSLLENKNLLSREPPSEEDMPGKVVVPDKAVTPIPMYSTKPFRALIHLYQADGLPAADEGGSSDTYCLVRIGRQQTQTQVFPNTLAPSFFATCELKVDLPVHSTSLENAMANTGDERFHKRASKQQRFLRFAMGKLGKSKVDPEKLALQEAASQITTHERNMRVPMQPEATHLAGGQQMENKRPGEHSLQAEEDTAAKIMEGATVRNPAVPDETRLDVKIIDPSLGQSDEQDLDDVSSTAGGSEISSTLSYVAAAHTQSDGMIMWWAAPLVHLTFFDAEKGGTDEVMCMCSLHLMDPQSSDQPPVPTDGVKRPEWHDLRSFTSAGASGRALACCEVLPKSVMQSEGNLVFGGEGNDSQSAESERVVSSHFGKSILYSFNNNMQQLLSFGGPGVSRLKLTNSLLPVQVDFVVVGLRQLQPQGLKMVTGVTPLVEVEITGLLPLPKAEFVDKEVNALLKRSRTSTQPSSTNPSFNVETLTIRGMLPLEPKLCVHVNIRVKDGSKTSISSLIGSAVLRLDTSHLSPDILRVDDELDKHVTEFRDSDEDTDKEAEEDEEDDSDELSEDESGEGSEGEDSDSEEDAAASVDIQGIQLQSKDQARKGKAKKDLEHRVDVASLVGSAAHHGQSDSKGDEASSLTGVEVKNEKRRLEMERKLHQQLLDAQAFRKGHDVYPMELEQILKNAKSLACNSLPITRGSGEGVKVVGKIKYLSKVRPLQASWKDHSGVSGGYKLLNEDTFGEVDELRLALSRKVTVLVRLVVLQGMNLVPKDRNNLCDPYLVVSLGSKKINMRKQRQKTTAMPIFQSHFDFNTQLPGQADLRVAVWDYDPTGRILGDDPIGETVIDLEDRWFSPEFQRMRQKVAEDGVTALMPIELRQLYDPTGKLRIPQGQLELWVEMYDVKDIIHHEPSLPNLTRADDVTVELRVVIWEAQEMEEKDSITQANDLYIKVTLQGIDDKGNQFSHTQKTDTHWRAQNGRGSFNWRIIFRFPLNKLRQPRLKFQAFDKDFNGRDDNIGEFVMSLKPMTRELIENPTKLQVQDPAPTPFTPEGGSKWIDLYHPSATGVSKGQLRIQLALMTEDRADQIPAGPKRSDPNNNPKLPMPEREILSVMHPMDSITTLVGKKRLQQVLMLICTVLLVLLAGGMTLVFANDFVAALITKAIG